MKKIPKIIVSTFLTIFILQMIGLIVLLSVPAQAADVKFKPQIEVPGLEKGLKGSKEDGYIIESTTIGEYIKAIYKYAIGVVGILAAVVLMIGGIVWLTAGGNQTRIGEAKAWIGASLTGLIIALTSYMILWTVNPALVRFKPIKVATVTELKNGCCELNNGKAMNSTDTDCPEDVGVFNDGKVASADGSACVNKETVVDLKGSGPGCCIKPGLFGYNCDYVSSQDDCDDGYEFLLGVKCEEIDKCQ